MNSSNDLHILATRAIAMGEKSVNPENWQSVSQHIAECEKCARLLSRYEGNPDWLAARDARHPDNAELFRLASKEFDRSYDPRPKQTSHEKPWEFGKAAVAMDSLLSEDADIEVIGHLRACHSCKSIYGQYRLAMTELADDLRADKIPENSFLHNLLILPEDNPEWDFPRAIQMNPVPQQPAGPRQPVKARRFDKELRSWPPDFDTALLIFAAVALLVVAFFLWETRIP